MCISVYIQYTCLYIHIVGFFKLRCCFHNMKLTIKMRIIQGIRYLHNTGQPPLYLFPKGFLTPGGNTVHTKQSLPTSQRSPSPWRSPAYSPSLWTSLCWTVRGSGITQHVTFCDWPNLIFSKFICISA